MQEIEAFGQSIDEFLVLSCILAQIDLSLAVTGIFIVLAAVEEIAVRLVVMLVDDGHSQFVGQLPTILQVGIAGMRARTCRSNDYNLGMSLDDALIHILKSFDKFGRNAFLIA